MIIESVEQGPLIWQTIEENGVIRPKKYSKLTPSEAIQADCDVKATNIILQVSSEHQVSEYPSSRMKQVCDGCQAGLGFTYNEHLSTSQPLFDELLTPPPSVDHPAPEVIAPIAEVIAPKPTASTGSPSSATVDQDAPLPSNSQTTTKTQSSIIPGDVEVDNHDLDVAHMNNDLFFGILILEIILTGIDNDIYSIVDACPNVCEMWKAIERLKQGESINVQDLETNMYWEFRKFTSRDGESLESYYSRFYKMINELVRDQCDVTNHQVNVQFLLQLRPEWQRNRGKAIVNSSPPIYDQEPSVVTEDDEMLKDKEIDKLMAFISLSFKKIYKPTNNNLRTSSNTSRANQDNSPRINRSTVYDNQRIVNVAGARENVARECQKLKRTKDAAYHKEKMLLCKQEEAVFQLNAKQANWWDATDDEPEDQELEAHYIYMTQLQEVTPDVADNS
nr:hypothetical protein [Tanacetum cinerariifolium]